jgi:Uma2 family endonuclease
MATDLIPPGDCVPAADERIVLHLVPWSHYEAQVALRGDASVPRITFLDGAMELMSPSREHERLKSYIGRLLEAFALERGIDLSPYGSWTLRAAPQASGVEADECYIVGDQAKDLPDLAVEVVWTRGGIDKLEIYRRLGVGEVWVWRAGSIEVHALRAGAYERCDRSGLFPDLDLALLITCLDRPTALQAVRAFRDELRARAAR